MFPIQNSCRLRVNTSTFETLSEAPLRALTQKVLFLLALATAKRVGELQALSSVVTFVHGDACLSYVPQFVAKSESLTRSISRSFLVKSLSDFAAGLDDDLLLCPVRALRIYLDRLSSLSPLRHRLFVSPRRPTRPLSKNAVSFFLRDMISSAGASRPEVGRISPQLVSLRCFRICHLELQFCVFVILFTRPSTRIRWPSVSGSVCGCRHEDRVALTSS